MFPWQSGSDARDETPRARMATPEPLIFHTGQDEALKARTYGHHVTGVVLIRAPGVGFRRHWARCDHISWVEKDQRVAAQDRYCFETAADADHWAWRTERLHPVWCRRCEEEG